MIAYLGAEKRGKNRPKAHINKTIVCGDRERGGSEKGSIKSKKKPAEVERLWGTNGMHLTSQEKARHDRAKLWRRIFEGSNGAWLEKKEVGTPWRLIKGKQLRGAEKRKKKCSVILLVQETKKKGGTIGADGKRGKETQMPKDRQIMVKGGEGNIITQEVATRSARNLSMTRTLRRDKAWGTGNTWVSLNRSGLPRNKPRTLPSEAR